MDHDILMMLLSWSDNEDRRTDFLEQYRHQPTLHGQVLESKTRMLGTPAEPTFLTKDIVGGKRKSYRERDASMERHRPLLTRQAKTLETYASNNDQNRRQTHDGDRDADPEARSPSPDPISSPIGSQYSREGSPGSSPSSQRFHERVQQSPTAQSPMAQLVHGWPFAEKHGEWKPEFTQTDNDDIYRSN